MACTDKEHTFNGDQLECACGTTNRRMIKLENSKTWPKSNSVWLHHSGQHYFVLMIVNIDTDQVKFPTTIVYQNPVTSQQFCRKLMDWERSFIPVLRGDEQAFMPLPG